MSTTHPHRNKIIASLALSAVLLSGCSSATPPQDAANGAVERVAMSAAVPAALKSVNYKVKTTHNVNLRKSSTSSSKALKTIPKNTTLKATAKASNGWYKVTYKGKTGFIAGGYANRVGASAPASKKVNVTIQTTVALNLRAGASSSSKLLKTVPKGTKLASKSQASNGWYKVTYKGKTGFLSNSYVKRVKASTPGKKPSTSTGGGRAVKTGKYTTNRAGLTDRYFTVSNGADLYTTAGGSKKINDIPKNSIVYRDLKLEKKGGQRSGWYFVRTQGTSGWMKTAALKRNTNAKTSNSNGYTRAQVRKQTNGKIPSDMLVAIPWDKEKTLIAAPALKDLTRLNDAFKNKFGKNIDIDLAYRTRSTQDYLMRELGPYIAAKPGTSNHGWGMAIDVPETYDYSFRGKYYKWLKTNSKKYNWIHQGYLEEYRNGKLNPYREAWHFEYQGK